MSPGNADTLRCLESVDTTDVLLPTDTSSNPLGSNEEIRTAGNSVAVRSFCHPIPKSVP